MPREDGWLTAGEAAAFMGVKRDTVYAYVSRGLLHREREGRNSFFDPEQLRRLSDRDRSPEVHEEFGEASRLSTLVSGDLHYRGKRVTDLVDEPFESVASLLWTGRLALPDPTWAVHAGALDAARRATHALPLTTVVSDRLRVNLAIVTATDSLRAQLTTDTIARIGGSVLRTIVEALPEQSESPTEIPGGEMARLLWSRLSPIEGEARHLKLMNAALVLLAEHGLSPSTHAARIAASARADPYGVLAAGMGVGSGAVVGASATAVETMLSALGESHQSLFALGARLRDGARLPGFGHPQHPGGDRRAELLLGMLKDFAATNQRLSQSFEIVSVLESRGVPPPNAYLALGMMADSFEMAPGASEVIFAVARSAGWIAHALEEYDTGTMTHQWLRDSRGRPLDEAWERLVNLRHSGE